MAIFKVVLTVVKVVRVRATVFVFAGGAVGNEIAYFYLKIVSCFMAEIEKSHLVGFCLLTLLMHWLSLHLNSSWAQGTGVVVEVVGLIVVFEPSSKLCKKPFDQNRIGKS